MFPSASTKMAISALLIKELQVFAITWNDEYFTVPDVPPVRQFPESREVPQMRINVGLIGKAGL
jgi:hypothetical protein